MFIEIYERWYKHVFTSIKRFFYKNQCISSAIYLFFILKLFKLFTRFKNLLFENSLPKSFIIYGQ